MEAESERWTASTDEDAAEVSASIADQSALPGSGLPIHIYLGSPHCSQSTILEIENMHHKDCTFENFHRKFTEFVNHCLPSYGILLNEWTRFEPAFEVLCSFPRINTNSDLTLQLRCMNMLISRSTMPLRLTGSGLLITYDATLHSMAVHAMIAHSFNSQNIPLHSFTSSSCSSVPSWIPTSNLHSFSLTQQELAPNKDLTTGWSSLMLGQFPGCRQYLYQSVP